MNKILIYCILIYVACSVLFYFPLWRQVIHPENPNILVIQGESPVYEFIAEHVRNNILTGKNPFSPSQKSIYPFEWNYVLDDVMPISGFYFLFTRNILGIHQSFVLITLIASLLSSISMLLLLKRFGISQGMSFIGGLMYGFSPFISMRISAHPPYAHLYIFPLIFLSFYNIIFYRPIKKKIQWSLLLGLILAITVLTNLYYAAMTAAFIMILNISLIVTTFREYFNALRENVKYFFIALITSLLLLLPWLYYAYQAFSLTAYNTRQTLDQSIAFSADLASFFIPSRLNPFYHNTLLEFSKHADFYAKAFETFVYPGIIILIALILYQFVVKKLAPKTRILTNSLYITTLFLLILSCGPFLHIWGYKTGIVLPYKFLNAIPFVTMIRAPARFIAIITFSGTILAAFTIEVLIGKLKNKKNIIILLCLIAIIDLAVVIDPPLTIQQPHRIYNHLSQKSHDYTLLEIPFSIRDSIKHYGSYNTVWMSRAQLAHNMPSFSIYTGRVSDAAFIYFTNNPIFIYIDEIISRKNSQMPLPSASDVNFSANFLNIKYALVKNNETYSKKAEALLDLVHFKPTMQDNGYTLWTRKSKKVYQSTVSFKPENRIKENLMFGEGWAAPEEKNRWTVGKFSNIYFRTNKSKIAYIEMNAEPIVEAQHIKFYINKSYIGDIILPNGNKKKFRIPIKNPIFLKDDINILTLTFSNSHELASLVPNSEDYRPLSLNVSYLRIK